GIDDDAGALRREAGEHAVEDGHAADLDARLVAAAHAAREAAGEHEAEGGGRREISHCKFPSFRGASEAREPGIQTLNIALVSGFRVRAYGAPRNDILIIHPPPPPCAGACCS